MWLFEFFLFTFKINENKRNSNCDFETEKNKRSENFYEYVCGNLPTGEKNKIKNFKTKQKKSVTMYSKEKILQELRNGKRNRTYAKD